MEMRAECVKKYALRIDKCGRIIGKDHEDPGVELDHLAKRYAHDHNVPYMLALERTMANPDNIQLVARYNANNNPCSILRKDEERSNPSVEADRRVRSLMAEDKTLSYSQAALKVLDHDQGLARRYSSFYGSD